MNRSRPIVVVRTGFWPCGGILRGLWPGASAGRDGRSLEVYQTCSSARFMRPVMPTTHIDRDAIFKLRELQAPLRPSLEALTRDGAYTVEEVFAPGTAENGATEVELLVCRPAGEIRACLYFVHGGGMVMGDKHSNADGVLDLLKGEGIILVSVEHRLVPEFPHPSRSRTPTRPRLDRGPRRRARLPGGPPYRLGYQLGRRHRRGADPDGPRSGWSRPLWPASHVPDARQPQRQLLLPPDGRPGHLWPDGQRHRLDGPPRLLPA